LGTSGLLEPLGERLASGLPVLGTCAGLILLASEVLDGRPDQVVLGAVDLTVRRNAHGRQRDSFEAPLEITGLAGGPFPGVFIRAPGIERVGDGVEVLARLSSGEAVATRRPTPPCGPCTTRPGRPRCPSTPSSGPSSGGRASSRASPTSRSPTRATPPTGWRSSSSA